MFWQLLRHLHVAIVAASAPPDTAQLLGRSPELKDYVRTGAQSAWVEVEIKAGDGTHTLRRDFTIEKNLSTWHVDGTALVPFAKASECPSRLTMLFFLRLEWTACSGRLSTEAEAKKITKAFNIQVDNLWYAHPLLVADMECHRHPVLIFRPRLAMTLSAQPIPAARPRGRLC